MDNNDNNNLWPAELLERLDEQHMLIGVFNGNEVFKREWLCRPITEAEMKPRDRGAENAFYNELLGEYDPDYISPEQLKELEEVYRAHSRSRSRHSWGAAYDIAMPIKPRDDASAESQDMYIRAMKVVQARLGLSRKQLEGFSGSYIPVMTNRHEAQAYLRRGLRSEVSMGCKVVSPRNPDGTHGKPLMREVQESMAVLAAHEAELCDDDIDGEFEEAEPLPGGTIEKPVHVMRVGDKLEGDIVLVTGKVKV